MHRICLAALALLAACDAPVSETIAGAAPIGTVWQLVELDDAPFPAPATMTFTAQGNLAGQAPCNSFTAEQTAPLPWFDLGPLVTTRRACPALPAEQKFLDHLARMDFSEVAGDRLLLNNANGETLLFAKR